MCRMEGRRKIVVRRQEEEYIPRTRQIRDGEELERERRIKEWENKISNVESDRRVISM